MSDDSVRLGVMAPLSGLVGIYGNEIARAAQIACQEINENGGVLGRPLEVIIEDDASLPETSVAAAVKLIDEHKCSAIVGNLLSNSRIAVAYRVAEPRKIPYLNFSFYEGSIQSRYFFHFAALPNQQIHRMMPYMIDKYGPKVFFAGNNYEWPRGSIDAGKNAVIELGGKVLGEEYLPIGVTEEAIDRLLDQVEQEDPDIFVPYFAGSDQVLLLTKFTERKLKKHIAVVMGHYDEMMASQLSPEVRAGFYSSNTYFMSIKNSRNQDYLARMSQFPGVDGIWPEGNGILTNFGEGTYVCVKAFAEAVNAAGVTDAEAVVNKLRNVTIDAPQGSVKMNPKHHHAVVNTYLSRCDAKGVFNIIKDFGNIEPVIPERYNHQRILHEETVEDDIRIQARMLEQMSEAVLLVSSHDDSILFVNAGAEHMFGYKKDEIKELTVHDILNGNNKSPNYSFDVIRKSLERKGEWKGELSSYTRTGRMIYTSITISTFTHPVYGEVWLFVATDVTKLKETEFELHNHQLNLEAMVDMRTRELRNARDEAKLANRAKSEFLSRMSHELRTPMNAIMGFAQVLQLSELQDDEKNYTNEILVASEHLLDLINELLDLSKIESGTMVVVREAVNIQKAVSDVVRVLEPLLHEKDLTIENNCNSCFEVLADPTRLSQILINLISNAIKYNRDNGVIKIACSEKEVGKISVSVKDNGVGIASEKLDKVFMPFERLGEEYSNIEGAGIGLSLTKQIVELMGGNITVESEKNIGSNFTFQLTKIENSGLVNDSDNISNNESSDVLMLYVEDNAANMRVVEAVVAKYTNIKMITATSGEQGLMLAKKYHPNIILLDINLPGMDGYQILSELRADDKTKKLHILALTADATQYDIERGLEAGFDKYLTKPVKVNELLSIIKDVVENSHSTAREDMN